MTETVRELRLVVTTDEFDKALAFYRDELGLPEEFSVKSPTGRVAILAAGPRHAGIGRARHRRLYRRDRSRSPRRRSYPRGLRSHRRERHD